MRRSLLALLLVLATTAAVVISSSLPRGYAQTTGAPVGDEFNDSFHSPWVATCAPLAFPTPCPDAQGANTWSVNSASPGFLRILTQPGSLLGTSNNARNLILQPYSPLVDWTATTKMTFPATLTTPTGLGQTAGILLYQDADNFIYLARVFNSSNGALTSQIQFLQEAGGVDVFGAVNESGVIPQTLYLQVRKTGSSYQGFYCYPPSDCETTSANYQQVPAGVLATSTPAPTNTPIGTTSPAPTSTSVPAPTSYTTGTNWTSPQVGLFAYGGTNSAVANAQIPADFDWFRVGNQGTPAASPVPTGTGTATAAPATATTGPTSTATSVPATATATTAPTATPTNTPIPPTPTPTPKPKPTTVRAAFQYVSVWWHAVRAGTYEHVQVQARNHSIHGIWVLVYLPSGQHYYFFENTDANGLWVKEFPVPRNAISRYSHDAVITFQLWKGRTTARYFATFIVVR